jgi:cytochrome c oxidase subunit 1/cytochrome c oxidase subunit I+III
MPGTDLTGRSCRTCSSIWRASDDDRRRRQLGARGRARGARLPRLATVDHKRIGCRYGVTAAGFFLAGGIEAAVMRAQLAQPDEHLLDPEAYDQLFSMHGLTMIFLFVTPMLSGFGNYLVPLMIGARDMAFPRLNAFGYWVFLAAGLFMYRRLSSARPRQRLVQLRAALAAVLQPGHEHRLLRARLVFLGDLDDRGRDQLHRHDLQAARARDVDQPAAALLLGDPRDVVLDRLRDPLAHRGLPSLYLQRNCGLPLLRHGAGGDPLLWQHLFWIFGHPDVYIIFLPAVGIVSVDRAGLLRRPMVALHVVALATMATALLGFGVWVHHMFATGLPHALADVLRGGELVIAIPSGIQVFGWLATMITGRPVLATPFLYVLGFLVTFVIGGLDGVMFAAIPFDQQVTGLVLRRRPLPLRALRRRGLPDPRGDPLLAPEDDGPDARRAAGPGQLLARVRRLQRRVSSPMHIVGLLGNAAARSTPTPRGMGWGRST